MPQSKGGTPKPEGRSRAPNPGSPAPTLQENDPSFRILFMNNPQSMWVYDLKTLQFLEVNHAAVHHYGYSHEEFLAMRITDIRPAEDVPRLLADVVPARVGLQYSGQWRHLLKNGKIIDVEITSHTLAFGGRDAELVVVQDVTDRNRAEQALRESEERYRELIQGVKDYAICMLSPTGHVVSWNQGAERIKGYKAQEIIGSHFSRFYPPQDVETGEPERALQQAVAQGRHEQEGWRRRKDGSQFWGNMVLTAVRNQKGELHGFSKITRDITDRKRADEALTMAEQKYRQIFEEAIIGIFQSTPDGRLISANPAMAHLYGYESPEEMMGSIADVRTQLYVDPTRRDEFKRLLQEKGVVKHFELQVYRKDGRKIWLSVNARAVRIGGVVVRYEGTFEDISERKLLEDQLRQAQKMEAIGRLAGGVAHDFNNALAVITGYGDLLQLQLPPGDPLRKHAEEVGKAGRRAAALTRQLLGFSRKQVISPV
ncbi:MAG: PAS domain S-box protein, partial [Candidatus Sulfotelmatobacter sp.]